MGDGAVTDLLLGGRWHPVTASIGFIEASVDDCVAAFLGWRGRAVLEQTGCAMVTQEVRGSIDDALTALMPLTVAMADRYLFCSTASGWTAYLDNLWMVGNAAWTTTMFSTREVLGVRAVAIDERPHRLGPDGRGEYGTRQISWSARDDEAKHGFAGDALGIAVLERRWEMVEPDRSLPFADPRRPARRVSDRFTHDGLVEAAAAFGLRPFDEDFYLPDRRAVLVQDTSPHLPTQVSRTLQEAQAEVDPRRGAGPRGTG